MSPEGLLSGKKVLTFTHAWSGTFATELLGLLGAEVIQIEFDSKIISYQLLIAHFWKCHDPTTLDRQGLDIGRQYRSVIFYHSEKQKQIAETSKNNYQNEITRKIVTEIKEANIFYPAEEYHQKYIQKKECSA